jgi:hypothetical protein
VPGHLSKVDKILNRARGSIRISTSPVSGAEAYINDDYVGTTPVQHEIPAGVPARIRIVHPETEPLLTETQVVKDDVRDISLDLILRQSMLSLHTVPQGARVTIDGTFIGNTPVNRYPVRGRSSHEVSLTLDGHVPLNEQVHLAGGEEKTLNLQLKPLSVYEKEKKEAQESRNRVMQGQREAAVAMERNRKYQKDNFQWVSSIGIDYSSAPFENFDCPLMGYYLSVEKRFWNLAGVKVKFAHMLDWNATDSAYDRKESLYGAQYGAALPVYLFRNSFVIRPEIGKFSGKAKTVTKEGARDAVSKVDVSSLYYGLSVGFSPFGKGCVDLSAGIRRFQDSKDYPGKTSVSLNVGIGGVH